MLGCPSLWTHIPCHNPIQLESLCWRSESLPATLYLANQRSRNSVLMRIEALSQCQPRIRHLRILDISLLPQYAIHSFPQLESVVIQFPQRDGGHIGLSGEMRWISDERRAPLPLKALALRNIPLMAWPSFNFPSLTHLYLQFHDAPEVVNRVEMLNYPLCYIIVLLESTPRLEFLHVQNLVRETDCQLPETWQTNPLLLPHLRLVMFYHCNMSVVSLLPHLRTGPNILIRLDQTYTKLSTNLPLMGHPVMTNVTRLYIETFNSYYSISIEGESSGFWLQGMAFLESDAPLPGSPDLWLDKLPRTVPFGSITSFTFECTTGVGSPALIQFLKNLTHLVELDFRITSASQEAAEDGGDDDVIDCVTDLLRALAIVSPQESVLCPELQSLAIASGIRGADDSIGDEAYGTYQMELSAALIPRAATPLRRVLVYATCWVACQTLSEMDPPCTNFNPPIPPSIDVALYRYTYIPPQEFQVAEMWHVDGVEKYWELDRDCRPWYSTLRP